MAAERARDSRTFVSRSEAATEALGELVGKSVRAGTVVTLDGELGSGKTCFVRGLARGLDVVERVNSPTYALMHTYPGRLELYHFDAWMEGRERTFLMDGGLEWMQSGGVAAIEWGGRVADFLPRPLLALSFEHRGAHERRIRVYVVDRDGAQRSDEAAELARLIDGLTAPPGAEEVG